MADHSTYISSILIHICFAFAATMCAQAIALWIVFAVAGTKTSTSAYQVKQSMMGKINDISTRVQQQNVCILYCCTHLYTLQRIMALATLITGSINT